MLKGKVIETYDGMPVEDEEDYKEFKDDILRVYKLWPEVYKLQFCGGKKRPCDSYHECAQYFEMFKKWIAIEQTSS